MSSTENDPLRRLREHDPADLNAIAALVTQGAAPERHPLFSVRYRIAVAILESDWLAARLPATTDTEAAWEKWLNSPEQEFKANHDRASFMAGFAAASVSWAEQSDTANARIAELEAERPEIYAAHAQLMANQRAYHEAEVQRYRDQALAVVNARVAELRAENAALRAELDSLRNRVTALADEHWDWKAGRTLHERIKAIVRGTNDEPDIDCTDHVWGDHDFRCLKCNVEQPMSEPCQTPNCGHAEWEHWYAMPMPCVALIENERCLCDAYQPERSNR